MITVIWPFLAQARRLRCGLGPDRVEEALRRVEHRFCRSLSEPAAAAISR